MDPIALKIQARTVPVEVRRKPAVPDAVVDLVAQMLLEAASRQLLPDRQPRRRPD